MRGYDNMDAMFGRDTKKSSQHFKYDRIASAVRAQPWSLNSWSEVPTRSKTHSYGFLQRTERQSRNGVEHHRLNVWIVRQYLIQTKRVIVLCVLEEIVVSHRGEVRDHNIRAMGHTNMLLIS